ncbi:hypothetical protein [Burkholderia anthina]|uniref:hypothetical protein n=1 Tax=Burkholderia anthina TaxID=179879 RepID=UPI00158AC4D6|nr:hypothetical protein [Burkholderia anthina]
MRVVVFDPQDLEALTVIEVSQHFIRELEQGKRGPHLRFAIPTQLPMLVSGPMEPMQCVPIKTADVLMERFQRNGVWTWCAMALNPEICLLMRSTLLPGQRHDAQERERQAYLDGFTRGFLGAIS